MRFMSHHEPSSHHTDSAEFGKGFQPGLHKLPLQDPRVESSVRKHVPALGGKTPCDKGQSSSLLRSRSCSSFVLRPHRKRRMSLLRKSRRNAARLNSDSELFGAMYTVGRTFH